MTNKERLDLMVKNTNEVLAILEDATSVMEAQAQVFETANPDFIDELIMAAYRHGKNIGRDEFKAKVAELY